MRKKIILSLALTVIMLSACGSRETVVEKTDQGSQVEETEMTPIIEANENLLSVEITIPKDFFGEEGTTQEALDKTAEEKGIDRITLNEDGSATYKMSKTVHKKLLDEMKHNIEEACDKLINGETAVESYQKITYDDDVTKFSVYVDKASFSDFDTISALGLYVVGYYYQLFNCVPNEEIDVQVDFIDQSTNEVINTGKYSDMKENLSQPKGVMSEKDMLLEISDWNTKIWNYFVDFQAYRMDGKDCTGAEIDIELTYSKFEEEYANLESYNASINKLSGEFSDVKDIWLKLAEQMEELYTDIENNGVKEGVEPLNLDLLQQYKEAFDDEIRDME